LETPDVVEVVFDEVEQERRGGTDRQGYVKLGSVVDKILQKNPCPVFLISASI
jgi:nucleotide-binding universal stress UspA family protein